MGRIARLLSFVRVTRRGAKVSDVKVNPGGTPNVTAEHFSAPGDDSHPLPGDYVALNDGSGTGREDALGYLDTLNDPKALAGDKRIYARDSAGVAVVDVWLKNTGEAITANENGSVTLRPDGGSIVATPNSTFDAKSDGSIKGANAMGSFELKSDGNFLVNGVNIDPSGNITTPGSLNADTITSDDQDVTVSSHTHNAGAVPAPDPGS